MVIAVYRCQWSKVLKSFEHVQNFPPIWPTNRDNFYLNRIGIHHFLWKVVESCGKAVEFLIRPMPVNATGRSH